MTGPAPRPPRVPVAADPGVGLAADLAADLAAPGRTARAVVAVVLALVVVLGVLLAGPAARADDGTAAWAVAPCDASGAPTGETRFELTAAPGETVTQYVLVTNSSTVERAFDVYGADGFNTSTGGYDVGAAAVTATDVGSWVTTEASPVTVAALSTAVVPVTVTVPDGAAAGDHPGGVVVSPLRGQVTDDGVVVDTRIAVRLNVRVPGDLAPALDVRRVDASFGFTGVPFASAPATVRFEVVNTGNVKVVGDPRVTVTGPFGTRLARLAADETHEVLPGDSFTVTATVDDVEPLLLATASVDVTMAAAPGPDTEIPGVSASGRTTFLAVSWTGLAVLVVLALAVVLGVRWVRRRRREGEALWGRMVDEARAELEAAGPVPGGPSLPAAGGAGALGAALLLAAGLLVLPVADARADSSDEGSLTLTVPAAPASATPTAEPTASPGASPTAGTHPGGPASGGSSGRGGRHGAGSTPAPSAPAEPGDDSAGGGAAPGDDPAASAGRPPKPDLVWSAVGRSEGLRWTLAGLGGAGTVAVAVRAVLATRRGVAR